jgi:hypothetical protein
MGEKIEGGNFRAYRGNSIAWSCRSFWY